MMRLVTVCSVVKAESTSSHDAVDRAGVNEQPLVFVGDFEAAAAWRMFLFNWRLLACVTGVVAAGLIGTEFYIDPSGYLVVLAIAALYWRFGLQNARSVMRSNPRVSYCLVAMAQMILAVSVLTSLTYLATSIGFPLRDTSLLAWDRALGFDFRAYLGLINAYPQSLEILSPAYNSITWQMMAMGVVLPFAGCYRRSGEAICAFALALLVTTCISALVPAIGVYGVLGLNASDFPYFEPNGYMDIMTLCGMRRCCAPAAFMHWPYRGLWES